MSRYKELVDRLERQLIIDIMELSDSMKETAERLGIPERTLRHKCLTLGIDRRSILTETAKHMPIPSEDTDFDCMPNLTPEEFDEIHNFDKPTKLR